MGNFFALGLLQVAGYLFPLITVPYLAHTLGINYYGEIAFAMAIMVYFQTLVDYGFIFSAVRDIARVRENLVKVSEIYSKVMWSRITLVLVSLILLTACIILIPKLYEMKSVMYASFLMVVGHAIFPDWLFQAMEKMKYITIFNVGIKLVFTLAVFLFIHRPEDYLLQPMFTSFGYIISGLCALLMIKKWGIRLMTPSFRTIASSIKENFDLFVNQIVPNLYNSASILYMGAIFGNSSNAVFDAANRFNTAGSSLFSIISRTFYPFLARRIDKHTFFAWFNIITSTVIALFLFFGAPFIINTFFPSDFEEAIPVLQIISVSLVFLSLCSVYGTNYLILNGYEKKMRQITLYSSLIGLAIATPSIYFYSYIGVAITITSARGIMGLWSFMESRKIKRSLQANEY